VGTPIFRELGREDFSGSLQFRFPFHRPTTVVLPCRLGHCRPAVTVMVEVSSGRAAVQGVVDPGGRRGGCCCPLRHPARETWRVKGDGEAAMFSVF